jgi:hypothetical protein
MNDSQWLDRVELASRIYQSRVAQDQQSVQDFVKWLYREYGIVMPDLRKHHE